MSTKTFRFAAIAAAVHTFLAPSALAIVVFGGEGLDAPVNGFVGSWNGSSAVAVGDRWILTAAHVGGRERGRFQMFDERYRGVERFVNAEADLALIRLDDLLPGWHAITGDVSRGDDVLLAGAGRIAGDEVSGGDGYEWSRTRELTWGANVVESTRRGRIEVEFDADRRGSVDFEAGFAMNDSGGGVFTVSESGELLLAGVARGVSELGVTRRGSSSFAVLLSEHMDWINSILGEQTDWYTGWLEEQALLASLSDVRVETPAPGAAIVMLGAFAFAARRRR
jgi:hypothetical protein